MMNDKTLEELYAAALAWDVLVADNDAAASQRLKDAALAYAAGQALSEPPHPAEDEKLLSEIEDGIAF